ncbi:Transcriptional regulator, AbiEi antitoxin, Type IV TA system [Dethiosulfatibacter aminovorans DSM 17477]|uniref:Transcriptional regulator, AbiEi antitoxin, Type IV TA system n=1 Tax=Dethiosulfatibacter aminovorans DSM 17477 TaxID=1121476 RepID=A0A1M6MSF7_9FIRM|nr:type IV toxin-antitoxin system AbiEi family antitoxin domain-containing protein [Dethiosulfatibacter aminovorans]SHJ86438.1 Transcriptional regulator, AbiEi antitoxin, Type IV TA system [Dethiosulfatibacter aminovorans DSM 17477]
MTKRDLVKEIMCKNNGLITSQQAVSAGIDNKILQRMHKSGEIERIKHGVYMDPDQLEDEYLLAQLRCKKGIFSHETALFFHDLTDRTPFQMMLTIPSGYNTRLIKERNKYRFFYISEELHSIGMITMRTPYGNEVNVYDKERTICDCIKKKKHLDSDLVVEAIKQYVRTPGADYAKLLKYGDVFSVRNKIRQYIEVLS